MNIEDWEKAEDYSTLSREELIELKDLLHDKLSSIKFSLDSAYEDKEHKGIEIDRTWLRSTNYAKMKTNGNLRRATTALVKVNAIIKEEHRASYTQRQADMNSAFIYALKQIANAHATPFKHEDKESLIEIAKDVLTANAISI